VFTHIQQRKIILIVIVAAISSLIYNTAFTVSFAQVNNTSANNTSTDDEQSTQDYISNIRSLLNQTIDAYSANDTEKAKELATTAYLDNFEHIEDPIGEELSEEGEELLREQLGAQIDSNASIEEIKQTVNATNGVLDEAEESLTS
jgi:predicted lipid-binding transport protein (Tim44 family)